jgi:predicted nuclease of predicted toxin-antitoxin system
VADESCAMPTIEALRGAGHDVVAIAEVAGGATDDEVLARALKQRRVLITEDRDCPRALLCRRHPGTVS